MARRRAFDLFAGLANASKHEAGRAPWRNPVKPFRISIAWSMVVIALLAADCAAIQAFFLSRRDDVTLLVFGLLPTANLLLLGILHMGQDIVRRGESLPFWAGCEAFGWAAMMAYSVLCLVDSRLVGSYLETAVMPINPVIMRLGYDFDKPIWNLFEVVATLAILSLPSLAIALIGGFVSARFRIVVARRAPSDRE
jgi:hypothetical protein